jgi:hypothetical protein
VLWEKRKRNCCNRQKNHLTTLEKVEGYNKYTFIAEIEGYKHLEYTMHYIFRICQSIISAKEEGMHEHEELDIYNILDLVKSLVPESELEFLDEINH